MLSIGTNRAASIHPASGAFARPRPRSLLLRKRWLAVLPLLGAAGLAFNGSAPAEPPAPETSFTLSPQQIEGRWSNEAVRDLIAVAEESAAEGLNPADYGIAALRMTLDSQGRGPALDALAYAAALRLARDFAIGRIEDRAVLDWHIAPPADAQALVAGLDNALDRHETASWLRGLLPRNEQYLALRDAYARSTDEEQRGRLRANLERWRWMPRDLGDRHIYVNVPAYRLAVVSGGVEEASYNVVVGSPRTPTPQLALHAQSVVANPGWTVPQSIAKAGVPRGQGFRWIKRPDGSVHLWQAPGPTNALGRIKIDMPNPHAIYLHDTPNHAVFRRENRALSHGCVRVENIRELAASLGEGADVEGALSDPGRTRVFQLQRSVPVYIVYFTVEAQPDGSLRFLGDPYDRDRALLAKLGDAPGATPAMQMAVR